MGRYDQEIVRRFVAAREGGDVVAMRRCWEAVVEVIFDRVDGFVATAHCGRLDDEEHDLAVEIALTRISKNLMTSFRGTSMGELVNALKTLAGYACMDAQRKAISEGRRRNRSLDAGWDADAEDGAMNTWEVTRARRAFEDEEKSADVNVFFAWALPQLLESRRAVMELTIEGAELDEICARLGLTSANAYQLRSRGTKDLAKLKTQYDAS